MGEDVREGAARFDRLFTQMDRVYAKYARSQGFNYSSLYVFHEIARSQFCTQKSLCGEMFLPKQTVNSIVRSFQKQGLLELAELPEDRRHRMICLTEKGREYAQRVLTRITQAEMTSIGQFDEQERELFLRLMGRYVQTFSRELKK